MYFKVLGETVDSVELKCLVVSRGLIIDRDVYQKCGKDYRIYPNALTCNSFKLPDDKKGRDLNQNHRLNRWF